MNKLISFLCVCLFATAAHAQMKSPCSQAEQTRKLTTQYPQIKNLDEELNRFTKNYVAGISQTRDNSPATYIIPVVFHIIHNNGVENISDAQVYDAVKKTNDNLRKRNGDTSLIISQFQSIAADTKIEIRLARRDPNGNCTNGIDRIVSPTTYTGDNDCKLNGWPPSKYLNVWVVNNIESGAAGYAYLPAGGQAFPSGDGIVIQHNFVGTMGTSSNSHSYVLTHEIGHYLNLLHTWGDDEVGTYCGTDDVDDTPETMGTFSCNLSSDNCNSGIIENIQNYMDYSSCKLMFTAGQRARMHAALNHWTAGRNNLWSASNLAATGTDNLNYAVCAPVPVISPVTPKFVCAGSTVTFKSESYNGEATGWNWTFAGGSPATSTDPMPVVTFSTPGTYDVSLTTSNSSGSNSTTAADYVTVLPNTGVVPAAGFTESFETMAFPGNNWALLNVPGYAWSRVTNTGYNSSASLKIDAQGVYSGQSAGVVTPTYDFTGLSNPVLRFRMAHAQRDTSNADALRVYVSTDCGTTWNMRYSRTKTSLATTTSLYNNVYTPQSSHWREESVNLTLFGNKPNVRFRFEYIHGGGNNLFIDDINIDGTVGLNDTGQTVSALSVFPNPSAGGELAASFNLSGNVECIIGLVAADGRMVELTNTKPGAGHQLLRFDTRDVPPGFYTLWIQAGDESFRRPVIIKR